MKKFIYKAVMCICIVMVTVSCADFLDDRPKDSYGEEAIFSDLHTLDGYVIHRYMDMKSGVERDATTYLTDECYGNHNWNNMNVVHGGNYNADDRGDAYIGMWVKYFYNVRKVNVFMDQLETINLLKKDEKSTRHVEQLIGEMRFLRAYNYAELVRYYGGVPLVKKELVLGSPKEEIMITRSSFEDCVEFIVQELDEAVKLLPVSYPAEWLGRATKGAALALKSRILLHAASPQWNPGNSIDKWEAARDAARDVINLNVDGTINPAGQKVYELEDNFKTLFRKATSKEVIFVRQYTEEYCHFFDRYNGPNGYGGWGDRCVTQNLADAFEMEDGSMPNPVSLYGDPVTPTKDNDWVASQGAWFNRNNNSPWDGRDPRFYATIAFDGSYLYGRPIQAYLDVDWAAGKWVGTGGLDSGQSTTERWNVSKSALYCIKFMTEGLTWPGVQRSTAPWIYMRLGEIYLNYAEALYHCGDEDGAREYIERIRKRARGGRTGILPKVTQSGQALLEKIRHERRIELAFEEHRFFDVRRWKIAEQTESQVLYGMSILRDVSNPNGDWRLYRMKQLLVPTFKAPDFYLFPIPRYEIQRNPRIEQNPDYK